MILAVPTDVLARRGLVLPAAALYAGARSAAARRAIRVLDGLGQVFQNVSAPDVAGLISTDTQRYINSLPYNVEQGVAVTPDVFAANLLQEAGATCATWADRCAGYSQADILQLIQQAVAAYSARLEQEQQRVAATVQQYGSQAPVAAAVIAAFQGGGSPTAYSVPPYYQNVTTVSTPISAPTPTGGGQSSNTATTPVQYQLRNVSRPNMSFQAGDAFELTIWGPPNSPVSVQATQNGITQGTTPFGNTDGTGKRVLTGTMGAGEVGAWTETVMVGQAPPASFSFSVTMAGSDSKGTPAKNEITGGGGSTDTGAAGPPPPPPASPFDTSKVLIYGAIAAVAYFLLSSGRGRR